MNKVYEFNENIKKYKIDNAIIEYKNNIPNVSEKQIEFAKQLINRVFNLDNDGLIEVNYNRCGMGKSTVIKAILNQLVNQYYHFGKSSREQELDKYGAIVITDRLERLEEISQYKGLEDRCYFMRYNKESEDELYSIGRVEFEEQLKEQWKYPIVLISTQKYFKMKDIERNALYKWKSGQRKIKICDEKPPIISTQIIDEKYLSNIRVALEALQKGDDKIYLLEYWKKIYEWIDGLRDNYTEYDINWICGTDEDVILNKLTDRKFFEKLKEYVPTKIYDDILRIKEVNKNGCLFISSSDRDQDNSRQFILINDNTDKFDNDKCKTIIFDATAYYDIYYTICDKYKIFKFDDSKDSDINLHHIIISTSKRVLLKDTSKIINISEYINSLGYNLFIATYGKRSGIFQKFNRLLHSKDISYFGDIKGKNLWNNFSDMAQIGLNRKSDYIYLTIYIALNKADKKWNVIEDADTLHRLIEHLLETKKGEFTTEKMRRIMESDLVVDTVQNIMRIKCRHFNNKDICNVFLLCSSTYKAVVEKVKYIISAKKFEYTPKIFLEAKTVDRKPTDGKVKTNPQILLECLNNLDRDKIIKMKDIINESGLSRDQVKECRKSNESIRCWFESHKSNKKGQYIV